MPSRSTSLFDRTILKFDRLAYQDELDRSSLRDLPFELRTVHNGDYLVRAGEGVVRCGLLVEGYACRHKVTRNGGRQIVSFHIPGDILNLQNLFLERSDHNLEMISGGQVAWIPVHSLSALVENHPNIAKAIWRDTLIDASIFREWVVNVGRRTAKTRIAHMLCEFAARRATADASQTDNPYIPITQQQIADATGLTPVHVNRMIRALVEDGAMARGSRVVITDWALMRSIADFDPAYLHQQAA